MESKNPSMKMNRIDYDYLEWLSSQIDIPVGNPHTYKDLFQRMYETEFVWTVVGDDNRVQDGLDLRSEFLNDPRYGFKHGCSVLEVLIALSRRIAFTAGGTSELWAWQLLENLGLHHATDPLVEERVQLAEEIIDNLIWRTYERDGRGGFFPLNEAHEDQTKVEIWYQMQAYANEIQEP